MADKLESYFKKHLSDETPSEEAWNIPSDDVWEKAMPHIHKKRGPFFLNRNIMLISVLVLIVLTATLGIIFIPDMFPGKDQVPAGQAEIETMADEPGDAASKEVTSEDMTSASEVTVGEDESNMVDSLADSDLHKETQAEETGKPDRDLKAEKPAASIEATMNELKSSQAPVPDTYTDTRSAPYQYIQPMTAVLFFSDREHPDKLKEREALLPENTFEARISFAKRKNKFGIGVYYAPTYNNTAVVGELSAGMLETGNHYLYSGNYGLTAKYYFSDRLAITSGIGSLKVKSWSRAQTTFNYDGSNEHIMPGGEIENMSGIPMATPFGEIGTEITYRFPGDNTIPDGESMDAIQETHQEISYFSIPLGLEFDLLPINKKLQWYTEGGIRLNWSSGDATELNSRILHSGNDMEVVGEAMTGHPDFTDIFLDFYLGSGLSYSMKKYLLLQGSLRYSKNITKVNVQDKLSTRVQAIGLKISLIYFF